MLGPILLLLVAGAHARNYYWNGGTMNFSQPANWQGNFWPGANGTIPCKTTFGSPTVNIISKLSPQQYTVGQVLNLPANGALNLASDGTILSFTDFASQNSGGSCNGPSAIWSGGLQPEQRNDFYCHTNWVGDVGASVSAPPCGDDFVFFDTYSAVHVSVPNNVTLVAMRQLQVGNTIVTSNTSQQLSQVQPQVNLQSTTAVVYIGGSAITAVCQPLNQYSASLGQCNCYSSCPTPQQTLDQQAAARLAAQQAALALQAILNTYYVVPFTGTISSSALYLTSSQVQTIFATSGSNTTLISALITNLLTVPAAAVSGISISVNSGGVVTVSGMINATVSNLNPIGSTSTTAPTSISWTSSSITIPITATRVQTVAQSTISSTFLSLYASILNAQVSNTIAQQTTPVQTVFNQLQQTPNATIILNAANANTCLSTCATSTACNACSSSVVADLTSVGVNATTAATLADNLIQAKVANITSWPATVNTLNTTLQQAAQATQTQQNQNQATPKLYTVNSPSFYIGRTRTLADQLLAISSGNIRAFTNALTASVTNFQNIKQVWNLVPAFAGSVPPSSRRRAVTLAPTAIQVTFTYNISCLPADTVCQSTLLTSAALYTSLLSALDNGFGVYALAPLQCQLSGYTQWSSTCLRNVAVSACVASFAVSGNNAASQQVGAQAVYNITSCGFQPTFPNGTCLDPYNVIQSSALADAQTIVIGMDCASANNTLPPTTTPATTTAVPTTTTGLAAASGGGGGGGGGLGMAAGAAGGGVALIVIIIAVVLYRRKQRTAPQSKTADDRTVVAFENPMYDDPKTSNAQPTYDSAVHQDAGEGLYDEPAFNSNLNKANPVYQSTEDLSGGGYLDTEAKPKADGYLDVAPGTEKAEDVGYLG